MYDGDVLRAYAGLGVFIIGSIGLILAFFLIRSDIKAEAKPAAAGRKLKGIDKRVAALLIALVLAGGKISADTLGSCSEENLRAVEAQTGIPWEVLYWTFGCWMLPG